MIGISPDKVAPQAKFKEKYGLTFPLLADYEKEAAQAYGVWKEKNMYGKKTMGIERTTFVIGAGRKDREDLLQSESEGPRRRSAGGLVGKRRLTGAPPGRCGGTTPRCGASPRRRRSGGRARVRARRP